MQDSGTNRAGPQTCALSGTPTEDSVNGVLMESVYCKQIQADKCQL